MRLKNKKLVITGGATGIGHATALYCADKGAMVFIADNNEIDGNKCVSKIIEMGGKAWFLRTDVSIEEDVQILMETAEVKMAGIDGIVTAAAIARDSLVPIEDVSEQVWDATIDINLKGCFFSSKYAVPILKKTGGGVIVMIASGAGVTGGSSTISYGASKGGVNGLAMTLEAKLVDEGIRVNVVCPGEIRTPLKLGIIEQQVHRLGSSARSSKSNNDLGSPDYVARIIGFLLSDDADYVRGAIFTR